VTKKIEKENKGKEIELYLLDHLSKEILILKIIVLLILMISWNNFEKDKRKEKINLIFK
jgi:hypothetical protein